MTGGAAGGELVDVVDEHDHVVATVTRAEMRAANLRHRCVYLAVISSRHELLIHQRSPHKDVWPDAWDVAAGGVVAAGEPYEVAARRELREELGVDAPLLPVTPETLQYTDDRVKVAGRVFIARSDGPFSFDDGEVVAAEFVSGSDLDARLRRGCWCPDSVALVIPVVRPLLVG